jgi:hypothetical protein
MEKYKIVKFIFQGENETIAEGLTLAEAKEYCQGEDAHGLGWFYGYTQE